MKKLFILLLTAIVILTSCAGTKKDCRGVTHYKQKGGFYLSIECIPSDSTYKVN